MVRKAGNRPRNIPKQELEGKVEKALIEGAAYRGLMALMRPRDEDVKVKSKFKRKLT